jgi:chorismate mutase
MEEVATALRALLDENAALAAEVAALKAERGPQTDAQVQAQIAALIHAAMRFDREDSTPQWQAGNSHAEYRARQAATEIASMLRCGLKANDPLAEMWAALAKSGAWRDAELLEEEERRNARRAKENGK